MKMKQPTRFEIECALAEVEKNLVSCGVKALDSYVHRLSGQAFALRFALGYSVHENHTAQELIYFRTPYFLKRRLDLAKKETKDAEIMAQREANGSQNHKAKVHPKAAKKH